MQRTLAAVDVIELPCPPSERDVDDLAALLVDAVESGAAVSFVLPFTRLEAAAWWRKTLEHAHPRARVLVVRDDGGIVGTAMLAPGWAPNQPHRADVVKVIVHRRAQRRGIARALMHAIEAEARALGFTLLTLDAKRGAHAEALYRSMGWTYVGVVPEYAVDVDGVTPHDAVMYFKRV